MKAKQRSINQSGAELASKKEVTATVPTHGNVQTAAAD